MLFAFSYLVGGNTQGFTCSDVKGIYRDNACCDATAGKQINTAYALGTNADPPIPGVLQGKVHTHVLLGMAPDYPPYTTWSGTPLELGGFQKAFSDLMLPICGIKVDYILAPWSDCWTAKPKDVYFSEIKEYIGKGIWNGNVHGCTAYTHTKGERGD